MENCETAEAAVDADATVTTNQERKERVKKEGCASWGRIVPAGRDAEQADEDICWLPPVTHLQQRLQQPTQETRISVAPSRALGQVDGVSRIFPRLRYESSWDLVCRVRGTVVPNRPDPRVFTEVLARALSGVMRSGAHPAQGSLTDMQMDARSRSISHRPSQRCSAQVSRLSRAHVPSRSSLDVSSNPIPNCQT